MKKLFIYISAALVGVISLLPVSRAAAVTNPNLIANYSVETANPSNPSLPQNWLQGGWGTNNRSLAYINGGYDGSKALKTTITSYSSGDAKWYFAPVAVTGGAQYAYSDYYQSNIVSSLVAQYDNGSGSYSYINLGDEAASSTWRQASVNFTAPATAKYITIFHLISGVGWLTTDDFNLNSTNTTPPPPPTGGNLLTNPSVETANGTNPLDWQPNKWGTNSATLTYATGGHTGNRSLYINMASYTSGDAKWMHTPTTINSAQTYTYSDYYKSSVATELDAQYTDTAGKITYAYLATVPASSAWQQTTTTFTTPATAAKIVVMHLIYSVGWLQTDDFSLTTQAPAPPSNNMVPNPSLETVDSTNPQAPQNWTNSHWGSNAVTFSYPNGSAHSGNRSVSINMTSYSSGSADWFFTPQKVTAGQMYDFSDYYKSNVETQTDVTYIMSNGSESYAYLGDASPSPNSWTKFRMQFTVPANVVSMTVYHVIYSVGWLTTDDYSLTPFTYQGFNRPVVSLTFDDGYESFYTNGLPLLQKYGFSSTDFIITGETNNDASYMTSQQLKTLNSKGNEIGSHTVTHPDLTTLSASQIDSELKNSQAALQKWLGVPVKDFASPYGARNQQVVDDAKLYYSSYRGVEPGYNAKNNFDAYNILVQNVVATTSPQQVESWINQAKATKTWLVLVYHQVDPSLSPSAAPYNTYPSDLDTELSYLKSSGVTVETEAQALSELTPQL